MAGTDGEARKKAEMETRMHALRRYEIAPPMGSDKIRKKYKTELQRSIGEYYNNAIKRFETHRVQSRTMIYTLASCVNSFLFHQKLRQTMIKENTEAAIQQYSKKMEVGNVKLVAFNAYAIACWISNRSLQTGGFNSPIGS